MVIYAHTCLVENKHLNIGRYGHTQGRTNPNLSQKQGVRAHNLGARQSTGESFSSGSTLILRQPNIQFTIIIVIYTHPCLTENKYPNIRRGGHTQERIKPKSL